MEDQATKKPWQSKTMLLNGLAGLVLFLSLFFPNAHLLNDWLSSHSSLLGTIWAFANVALRAVTKDKISLSD